jgi:hypothetical protein
MKMLGVVSVPVLKLKIRVDFNNSGHVGEEGSDFSVFLPEDIIDRVAVGDYIEIICVPNYLGNCAEMVFQVELWVQGNGHGTIIFCLSHYWRDLITSRGSF